MKIVLSPSKKLKEMRAHCIQKTQELKPFSRTTQEKSDPIVEIEAKNPASNPIFHNRSVALSSDRR